MQVLGVTNIGSHSHVDSQAIGVDRHRLVDVFLWQLFPERLQSDFQLITHQLSYALAGVYDTFPAWCPTCDDSPVGLNLESLRATHSSQ